MEIVPMEEPGDRQYARLRYHLEKAGTPIGPNDMLNAAHTGREISGLVTANRKAFYHVPRLAVENWLVF